MKVQTVLLSVVILLSEIAWSGDGVNCDDKDWDPGTQTKLAPEDEMELAYGPSIFEDLKRDPASLSPEYKPADKPVLLKRDRFRD